MPQSTLSARRLFEPVGRPLPPEELERLLFSSKAEVADWTGDDLRIEVTADRLDLLSEGGLGLHLAGALGVAVGTPRILAARVDHPLVMEVDASTSPLRPFIGGLELQAPRDAALDAGLLAEAVRFQELLHATVGRDRRLASLGIYPLERLTGPVTYTLEPLSGVRFVPLDGTEAIDGTGFFETHPLAEQFGAFGRAGDRCLVLRDATREILSLPPILNSRTAGEARPGDRRLLLESTGTLASRVRESLGLLSLVFIARGWRVAPVTVAGRGKEHDAKAAHGSHPLQLTSATLKAIAGETLRPSDVVRALAQARLTARSATRGWMVDVPPWRPDLLAEVDLIEDLLFARGVDARSGIIPPTSNLGRRLPEGRFRERVAEALLGLGFVPLLMPVLTAASTVALLGRTAAIAVANPVSELYSHLRDSMVLSLAAALSHNVRHGYPQRLSEVGPVLVRDTAADSGAATRFHAGAVIAGERAGFADAAALLDYLLGALGTVGVREPVEIAGTIPGRAARMRLAGAPVGEVGELSPGVLDALGVPVPVAWAELDLTALWPLLKSPQTP